MVTEHVVQMPLWWESTDPKISGCPLCAMFVDLNLNVRDPYEEDNQACLVGQWLSVDTGQSTQYAPAITIKNNATFHDVSPIVAIAHPLTSDALCAPRVIDAHHIDFTTLRAWEQHCKIEHFEACHPTRIGPIPGFKVLDCRSRQIIKAPLACCYVALSYVWGETQLGNTGFPLTIVDTVEVTLKLGYEYLCKSGLSFLRSYTTVCTLNQRFTNQALFT
jgi:hypothetical protein